jgi:hypothetical protein
VLPSGSRTYIEGPVPSAPKFSITPLALGDQRPAAEPAERTIDVDQIDHRATGAHMHQAELVAPLLDRAAEDVAIELHEPLDIRRPEHQMVDPENQWSQIAGTDDVVITWHKLLSRAPAAHPRTSHRSAAHA